MKRTIILLAALLGLLSYATPCFADSPITSTPIYLAYDDVEIVTKASETGIVDDEIAHYLASPSNSIDIKAAVINGLDTDFKNKDNAERYSKIVYGKSVSELNIDSLNGHELFCLGYLMAVDDYFNTDKASELMQKARVKMSNSLTVGLVSAVVYSQQYINNQEQWTKIWTVTEEVINDKKLQQDLRREAAAIIVDYMSSYSEKPVINIFADENIIVLGIGNPILTINDIPFEIDLGRETKPELKNGRTFLPISPLINALGGTTKWDAKQQKVTILLEGDQIELWVGKNTIVVNGVERKIDVAPYLSNSRTMLPIRFIIENLGYEVKWDGETEEVIITVK